jgi:hypothetical protein
MATFIESSVFTRVCPIYLDDDEYAELQQLLLLKPEAGQVVPGSVEFGSFDGRVQVWVNAVD